MRIRKEIPMNMIRPYIDSRPHIRSRTDCSPILQPVAQVMKTQQTICRVRLLSLGASGARESGLPRHSESLSERVNDWVLLSATSMFLSMQFNQSSAMHLLANPGSQEEALLQRFVQMKSELEEHQELFGAWILSRDVGPHMHLVFLGTCNCNYCNTLELPTMNFHHYLRSKQQAQKQKAARQKYIHRVKSLKGILSAFMSSMIYIIYMWNICIYI